MAKIDDIYEGVDDFGLITSSEAAKLGMSNAELVQQAKAGKLVRVARGVDVYKRQVYTGNARLAAAPNPNLLRGKPR